MDSYFSSLNSDLLTIIFSMLDEDTLSILSSMNDYSEMYSSVMHSNTFWMKRLENEGFVIKFNYDKWKSVYELYTLGLTFYEYCEYSNIQMARLLLDNDRGEIDKNAALRTAAENGRYAVCVLLIEYGADVSSDSGYPLRWAARGGYLNVVQLLVENDAKVGVRRNYALRWAAESGHVDVVAYLISKGAKVTSYNNAAMKAAVTNEKWEVVALLSKYI